MRLGSRSTLRHVLLILGLSSLLPLAANAQLVHRYSLNGNANDSAGSANGTVVNPDSTASFTPSASPTAFTTVNTNSTDYLSLPSSVGSGITGDFSIEDWLTQSGAETAYTTIFSLAKDQSDFILLNPNRNGTGTTADFDETGVTSGEVNINAPGTSFKVNGNFGTELQIVLTYVSSTGVASMYSDGTLLASGNVGTGFNFQAVTSGAYDGINGGDPYADPDFQGSTDDFRIYSQALTPTQISALDTLGPNATNAQITGVVPEPASMMLLLGAGTLLSSRRVRRRA